MALDLPGYRRPGVRRETRAFAGAIADYCFQECQPSDLDQVVAFDAATGIPCGDAIGKAQIEQQHLLLEPSTLIGVRAAGAGGQDGFGEFLLFSAGGLDRGLNRAATPWNPPPALSRRRARIVAELAPLMPPTQTERDARWLRAARQAKVLAWFSLAWMTGEGVLGLIAGITANSISLIGWALGSVIEGLASIIVIWRFTGSRTVSETSERRAQRAVAVSFFLLAPYIGVQSIRALGGAHEMTPSVLGVAVTAASLVVMPLLGRAKQRLGERLDSGATTGEGMQNYLCAAQAGAVLLGLGATAAFGWIWLDPVIGLLLAGRAVYEGIEAWQGEDCC